MQSNIETKSLWIVNREFWRIYVCFFLLQIITNWLLIFFYFSYIFLNKELMYKQRLYLKAYGV